MGSDFVALGHQAEDDFTPATLRLVHLGAVRPDPSPGPRSTAPRGDKKYLQQTNEQGM